MATISVTFPDFSTPALSAEEVIKACIDWRKRTGYIYPLPPVEVCDYAAAAKLRKRDTRVNWCAMSESGTSLYFVYDEKHGRALYGPAPRKACVAWRKEHME